ncbi:MAG: hypothetical protein NXY57DRAFT_959755 [Lentinula lateritia]|nr:MAG: hypothetical protein NXY57DRAFT_959755 [Lentinula lateritia]
MTMEKIASSPISNLPHEIYLEIFSWCCIRMVILKPPWRNHLPTLVLGQVCKLWHAIIEQNPQLWSTFCAETMGPESALTEVLRRSKHSPLYLTIWLQGSPLPSCLLTTAPRIQQLSLLAFEAENFVSLFNQEFKFPALKSLNLRHRTVQEGPYPIIDPFSGAFDCSVLTSLLVSRLSFLPSHPLPSIRFISINHMRLDDACKLLTQCPNVEHIHIGSIHLEDFPGNIVPEPSFHLPVALKSCVSLSLHTLTGGAIVDTSLQCFQLPNLTSLQFERSYCPTSAIDLLQHSQHLTSLNLHNIRLSKISLPQLLTNLANLRDLSYSEDDPWVENPTGVELFRYLCLHQSAAYLPALERLTVSVEFRVIFHVLTFCELHTHLDQAYLTLLKQENQPPRYEKLFTARCKKLARVRKYNIEKV